MVHDGAPRAVLISVAERRVTDEDAACIRMLQVEQVLACDLLACLLSWSVSGLLIADELPVVALVTQAIVTIPRNLLPLAQRRLKVGVGVQVLPCRVMLESHRVSTLEATTGWTRTVRTLSISNDPQRFSRFLFPRRRDNLLS